jgi:hypothetical protein
MMSTKAPLLFFLLATALLNAGSEALADAPAGDEATAKLADAAFKRGKALVKRGKQQEARVEYLAAFAGKKSYDAAGNLGSLEVELRLFRDAAEHLLFAVRHYAPSGTTPAQLEKARGRLRDAKLHVAEVAVNVKVDGAEVLVDGAPMAGRAPLEAPLFLEPGSHKLEARLAGFEAVPKIIDFKAGSSTPVTLELVAAAQPASIWQAIRCPKTSGCSP